MDLTSEKCGDYLIPNLVPDLEPEGKLRKFGLMLKHCLKEYRGGIYQGMVLSGTLKEHLLLLQEQAEARFDVLVEQMAEREGVTEQLKAQDQVRRGRRINSIRERMEEIVREEIIYILLQTTRHGLWLCLIALRIKYYVNLRWNKLAIIPRLEYTIS